jgi:transcriptional regulator with XRE-family HTH domain
VPAVGRPKGRPTDAYGCGMTAGPDEDAAEVEPARKGRSRDQAFHSHLEALGNFIRSQRKLADLSLRDLAEKTNVSNPYLSQIERGLHEPSVRVLRSIARALNVSAETLLTQAGILEDEGPSPASPRPDTEKAIRADPELSEGQKDALLSVYRSYRASPG